MEVIMVTMGWICSAYRERRYSYGILVGNFLDRLHMECEITPKMNDLLGKWLV
jgi:hypothetical protein